MPRLHAQPCSRDHRQQRPPRPKACTWLISHIREECPCTGVLGFGERGTGVRIHRVHVMVSKRLCQLVLCAWAHGVKTPCLSGKSTGRPSAICWFSSLKNPWTLLKAVNQHETKPLKGLASHVLGQIDEGAGPLRGD